MSKNLFPVFEVPQGLLSEKPLSIKHAYPRSPKFDIKTGEFSINGAGQLVYGSGYDAWVLWCHKTIMTQRFAHLAYSKNVGIEAVEAFSQPDREAIESAFEKTITEALLADPLGRTRLVKDFKFEWFTDELFLSCCVIGYDGNSADIKASIRR